MKKLLFTLAAMLMAGSAFAGHWVTFDAGDFEETLPYGYTLTNDGVTITAESGMVTSTEFRIYADSYLTVASEDGIMCMVFTCTAENNNKYGPGKLYYLNNRGQYTYDSYMGYWDDGYIDEEGVFNYYNPNDYETVDPLTEVSLYANAQCRCTQIAVYVLSNDEPAPTERTDSPSASKVNYVHHDGDLYSNAYTVTLTPAETEPDCVIWYRIGVLEDGDYVFGPWTEYVGPFNVSDPGSYRIEAYAITEGKLESYPIADEFVVSRLTDVEELFAGKTVASVRYFNVAGQEMQQANGLTIMVTTYTDGTTNAVKVVK